MTAQVWEFPAVPEAVGDARRAIRDVAERLGADEALTTSIVLCVSEAVSNAVMHAYREHRDPGGVEVEASRPNGFLCFYVRDRGIGLRPRADSPGGGYGLRLITQLASGVTIRSGGPNRSGTELAMRFDLGA